MGVSKLVGGLMATLAVTLSSLVSAGETYDYPASEPLRPDRLRVADLVRWTQENRIEDLDSLLQLINKKGYAKNLQSFALMHASRSLHRKHISPLFPRVIFSHQGLTGAVTGDPSDPESYQSLELVEFDDKKNDFVFSLIEFSAKKGETGKATPSPSTCTECHGKNPRPIWAAYPVWPGSYGSDNDKLTVEEQKLFKTFLTSFNDGNHDRYKLFQSPNNLNYLDPKSNLKLGLELNFQNYRKTNAQLVNSGVANHYGFALLAASKGCKNISEFLPDQLALAHEQRLGMTYEQLKQATRDAISREAKARVTRYNNLISPEDKTLDYEDAGQFDFTRAHITAKLRYLIEGQSMTPDLEMSTWALSYAPTGRSYSFSNGHFGIEDLYQRELKNIATASKLGTFSDEQLTDCDWLKDASVALLKTNPPIKQ